MMTSNLQKRTFGPAWVVSLLLAPIVAVTGYLLWVASYIKIDYYDSFLILLNARCVATLNVLGYSGSRPIILPIVLSPIFLIEKLAKWPGFGFVASHMFMILFFVLLVWVTYRLFRFQLGRGFALAGVALMSLNNVLVHASPFCKEDVFAAFLLSSAFYFYLKSTRKGRLRDYAFSGFFISLAIGARYNYPILFLILALYEILSGRTRFALSVHTFFLRGDHTWRKFLFLLILPILFFAVIVSAHYSSLGISSFQGAFYKYLSEPVMYMARLVRSTYPLPPIYYFIFLQKACTWPLILSFSLGLVANLKRLKTDGLFHLLWFSVFFGLHAFWVAQKEARFLIAVFPPFYFFVALGIKVIFEFVKQSQLKWPLRRAVLGIVIAAFAAPSLKQTLDECARFRDPVYHVDFPRELAQYAVELAGNNRLVWIGPFYPVHPKNYIFHIEDMTYYIHHLYASAVFLHTGRFVNILDNAQFLISPDPNQPLFLGPKGGLVLDDGDVSIINVEKESFNTKNLPKELKPLYVQRARKTFFERSQDSTQDTLVFLSSNLPDSRIEMKTSEEGLLIRGLGIPPGRYEIYAETPEASAFLPLGISDVRAGILAAQTRAIRNSGEIKRIFLFYFDSLRKFTLPR